jgi:hypothetical protein
LALTFVERADGLDLFAPPLTRNGQARKEFVFNGRSLFVVNEPFVVVEFELEKLAADARLIEHLAVRLVGHLLDDPGHAADRSERKGDERSQEAHAYGSIGSPAKL